MVIVRLIMKHRVGRPFVILRPMCSKSFLCFIILRVVLLRLSEQASRRQDDAAGTPAVAAWPPF